MEHDDFLDPCHILLSGSFHFDPLLETLCPKSHMHYASPRQPPFLSIFTNTDPPHPQSHPQLCFRHIELSVTLPKQSRAYLQLVGSSAAILTFLEDETKSITHKFSTNLPSLYVLLLFTPVEAS